MTRHKLNIAQIVPDSRVRSTLHGLYGYREIIETIRWGLGHIGSDVTVSENSLVGDRINVIVGVQMLQEPDLKRLPDNTIIYNFEQIRSQNLPDLKPEIRFIADHFRIWDYSEGNIESWKKIGPASRILHVPVGWAPILNRIEKREPQDIDVLIYGSPGQLRLEIFQELCHSGMKCVFLCGMYGQARDELIGRAKIVLNLNLYERSRIFEIVRVS